MPWAGDSIYAIPRGGRKKKRKGRRAKKKSRLNPPIDDWHLQHEALLESPRWARIRQKVIIRDLGRCQTCGAAGRDVHHIHYRTLGSETGDELILLCRLCHKTEHKHYRLSDREDHWIAKRNRTRGAVCLERVGAGPSSTPGAQVEVPGYQGNQESKPCRTSQSASMVRSRGGVEPSEKAMPHQARAGDVPAHGSAGLLLGQDATPHQSPTRVVIRRRSRSGKAMETRTG